MRRRVESLNLPAPVPTDDNTWRVVEMWIQQRRIPGSMAVALLRAACTTVMRAYARGRLHEAARVTRHPQVLAMTEDQISAYIEATIGEVLRRDAVRERYELIENATYTSMTRTSDDEYLNMWFDVEKSLLESPTFQTVRDEIRSASNNAFRAARRAAYMARMPPATPVKTSTKRAKMTTPGTLAA